MRVAAACDPHRHEWETRALSPVLPRAVRGAATGWGSACNFHVQVKECSAHAASTLRARAGVVLTIQLRAACCVACGQVMRAQVRSDLAMAMPLRTRHRLTCRPKRLLPRRSAGHRALFLCSWVCRCECAWPAHRPPLLARRAQPERTAQL